MDIQGSSLLFYRENVIAVNVMSNHLQEKYLRIEAGNMF